MIGQGPLLFVPPNAKLSCRAGWLDKIPRKTVMPARSAVAFGSARNKLIETPSFPSFFLGFDDDNRITGGVGLPVLLWHLEVYSKPHLSPP
jgi:hypothetical protein